MNLELSRDSTGEQRPMEDTIDGIGVVDGIGETKESISSIEIGQERGLSSVDTKMR